MTRPDYETSSVCGFRLTNKHDIATLKISIDWFDKYWWRYLMKPSKSSGFFKPFKNLDTLLAGRQIKLKPAPIPASEDTPKKQMDHRQERAIFNDAMADVKRISRSNCPTDSPVALKPPTPEADLEYESIRQLKDLVNNGTGFVVSLTPEYIEGIAHGVNPAIAHRLHRGDFSIQAHTDLHGLGVEAAREIFDEFFHKSIAAGKNAVLIIHGRGLSSPVAPVLKTKVYRWLTTSPWHKWVVAFTSARLCDGGAGATYVLLRQRPLTKRFRQKRKKSWIEFSSALIILDFI
jgi:DNA-nicking Smr family endonuclease